jgi:hypothetical protein
MVNLISITFLVPWHYYCHRLVFLIISVSNSFPLQRNYERIDIYRCNKRTVPFVFKFYCYPSSSLSISYLPLYFLPSSL